MSNPTLPADFLVACLCAEWCGTCRDYRAGFSALATQFADTAFRWIDIEDAADAINSIDGIGDMDFENFPTLLIFNHDKVVFFGPMLPQPWLLERTFNALRALNGDALTSYISANEMHRQWQRFQPLRAILFAYPPA
ncbi:hypothetical protein PG1C_09825 [Rugosibacter aromaticivorans]|uniref:Thioredoxin domain-containing protein n=1 Tax=Rugosibacter aromaticivorans TaxID=1565605 RepID=A0A0C5JCP6_9PROT|nr:hypothetical protein PG1C_09825 [Rugosibacter aromaticivorans]TBR13387.1 MAG: thioredoxin [Rugosibacter sp.]